MDTNKPVIILIFLVITIILSFLFVLPKYEEYRALRQTSLEKQAKYSGESIYYARIADILSGLEERKEVLDKMQEALPQHFSLAPLVDFLQKKGNENGVAITSMVFSQITPLLPIESPGALKSSEIKDVLFTLTVAGSYQGLKNFLFAMDNSARLFEMDTLSLSAVPAPASKNKPQQYTLKLEVKTHTY